MSTELATALHEAGHCVATLVTFTKRLPHRARPVIRFVEIGDDGTGNCQSSNVYTPGRSPIDDDHFWLMGAQVAIELAGGVAESFHRVGTRLHGAELLAFAQDHCGIDRDLERAEAVLADMKALTGFDFYSHEFVDSAAATLFEH